MAAIQPGSKAPHAAVQSACPPHLHPCRYRFLSV